MIAIMKKSSIFALSALLALASCAPQAFVVNSQMRGASTSGLNLNGKTMGIVYVYGDEARDTVLNGALVTGFATRLEADYFNGSQEIEIFKMHGRPDADYSSKDSLVNLVMDTGKDVVFLFDKPIVGTAVFSDPIKLNGSNLPADSSYASACKVPFTTTLYVYDSMNKDDKVLGYSGSKEISTSVYSNGKASKAQLERKLWTSAAPYAEEAGSSAAKSFLSTWNDDQFYVIYYDGAESAWDKGARHAYSFEWKEAIEDWLPLVKCKGSEKKACAAYNIALGCFMMGQPKLAIEWLDRSDSYEPVSLSKSLRSQIKKYTGVQ